MKTETKIKKLTLKKETLRDLTARHAGEVKGGILTRLECSGVEACLSRTCATQFIRGCRPPHYTKKQGGC